MTQVRRATNDDAAAIARLNRDVQQVHADAYPWMFKQPDTDSSFTAADARATLQRPGYLGFIAVLDSRTVGYAFVEERRRPETGRHYARDMIFIHEISVCSETRRQGVGRALITAIEDYGRSVGIDRITLETWAFNTDAQTFFARCGLTPARIMMWNRTNPS